MSAKVGFFYFCALFSLCSDDSDGYDSQRDRSMTCDSECRITKGMSFDDDDNNDDVGIPSMPILSPAILQRGMQLQAVITAYGTVRERGKQFTVYVITVIPNSNNIMWRVYRRYRQFEELREELQKIVS